MAETIDEINYDYEDEGKLVRRTLKKEVLTRGGWSTIMFLYEDLDRKTGKFGAPKIAIVRFKKWQGNFRKQSSFAISSEKQARQLTAVIDKWLPEMGTKAGTDEAVEEAGEE
jgi:hypothetical protein